MVDLFAVLHPFDSANLHKNCPWNFVCMFQTAGCQSKFTRIMKSFRFRPGNIIARVIWIKVLVQSPIFKKVVVPWRYSAATIFHNYLPSIINCQTIMDQFHGVRYAFKLKISKIQSITKSKLHTSKNPFRSNTMIMKLISAANSADKISAFSWPDSWLESHFGAAAASTCPALVGPGPPPARELTLARIAVTLNPSHY